MKQIDDYDAYHLWLGIPPEEQPPSHYRLLGLRLFEQNIEVIRNAADRQRTHVKRLGVNQYQQRGQELLNEIEAAKICLLRPEKREIYDEQLRTVLLGRTADLSANKTIVQIAEETLIVGSDPSCDVVIDLPIISGSHCSVTRRAEQVILQDLGSTNGTFVNLVRVLQPVNILLSDLIVLGRDTRLKLPTAFYPAPARSVQAVFVGRNEQCEIRIADSTVSSFHARIIIDQANMRLEDLGSTNGTSLSDQQGRLHQLRPYFPTSLYDWEQVSFGKHKLPLARFIQDVNRAVSD